MRRGGPRLGSKQIPTRVSPVADSVHLSHRGEHYVFNRLTCRLVHVDEDEDGVLGESTRGEWGHGGRRDFVGDLVRMLPAPAAHAFGEFPSLSRVSVAVTWVEEDVVDLSVLARRGGVKVVVDEGTIVRDDAMRDWGGVRTDSSLLVISPLA